MRISVRVKGRRKNARNVFERNDVRKIGIFGIRERLVGIQPVDELERARRRAERAIVEAEEKEYGTEARRQVDGFDDVISRHQNTTIRIPFVFRNRAASRLLL